MRIALRAACCATLPPVLRCAAQGAVVSIALFLFSTGPGCAPSVRVRFDEREDFSRFYTWGWLTPGQGRVETPVGPAPRLRARIASRIRETLDARGLRYAADRADLHVDFQLSIERRTEVVTTTPAMESLSSFHDAGYYEVQVSRRELHSFEIGRLVVILYDPTRGTVVWRGEFVGLPKETFAPHVDEVLSRVLSRLPPVGPSVRFPREIISPPRLRELASR